MGDKGSAKRAAGQGVAWSFARSCARDNFLGGGVAIGLNLVGGHQGVCERPGDFTVGQIGDTSKAKASFRGVFVELLLRRRCLYKKLLRHSASN